MFGIWIEQIVKDSLNMMLADVSLKEKSANNSDKKVTTCQRLKHMLLRAVFT